MLAQCNFDPAECDIELAAKFDVQVPLSIQRNAKKRLAEFIAGRYLAKLCLIELTIKKLTRLRYVLKFSRNR